MKTIKRALCLLLCFTLLLGGGICAAAGNDDPLTWKFNHSGGGLLSRFAPNTVYTHDPRFKDGYDVYKVIDVSYHNGDINWNKVAADGIYGVMIRAGYRGYGDAGTLNEDVKFKDNLRGAKEAGLKVGVYFYSQAVNVFEAEREASYTVKLLDGEKLDLPVAYDLEYAESSDGYIGRLYDADLSRREATALCVAFCETVKFYGYSPMLYSNKFMLRDKLNADDIESRYPIWLACYNDSASYSGDYVMWQYTSKDKVSGIKTNCDMSFYYLPKPVEEPVVPQEPDVPVTPPDVPTDEPDVPENPPQPEEPKPEEPTKPADKPSARVDSSTLLMNTGDSVLLGADVELKDIKGFSAITKTELVWESSKPSVVNIDSAGKATAFSAGYADIKVTVTIIGYDTNQQPTHADVSYVITICVSDKAPEKDDSSTDSVPKEEPEEKNGFVQIIAELFSAIVNVVMTIIAIFQK